MPESVCKTPDDLDAAFVEIVKTKKFPITVTWKPGDHTRTLAQNRLQHLWNREIAQQRGDESAEYYRSYNKLRIGVPILRNSSDEYRDQYDRLIKPLPYEEKIQMMMLPLDFPVTSAMTVRQKTEFLDSVYHHWVNEQGLQLTEPPDNWSE